MATAALNTQRCDVELLSISSFSRSVELEATRKIYTTDQTQMAHQLTELQHALRAIERGARLEKLDHVLVQRVLQQPVVASDARQQPLEATVSSKDAYKTLVQLRRTNNKKQQKQAPHSHDGAEQQPQQQQQQRNDSDAHHTLKHNSVQPIAHSTVSLHAQNDGHSVTAFTRSNNSDSASETTELAHTDKALQRAVHARAKELARSQQQVQLEEAALQTLLTQSQALLPSQYLFERQLTSFCQERSVTAIQDVLQRFQHRFYRLYFAHWYTRTLALRLIAQQQAVATIVRVYRGHCARVFARQVRQQRAEQQRHAAALLVFQVSYREHQARKVQMVWRRYQRARAIAERQQRRASATYLQRQFRDRRLRQNQLVHTLLHVKAIRAAIVLQKHVRGHRTRCRLRLAKQQAQRDALVAATLARSVSHDALVQYKLARRGAAFFLCTTVLYPYAVKRRLQQLVFLTRRQRAAQVIARAVCRWYGLAARRVDAQAKQLQTWLSLLEVEQQRMRAAAVRIQSHLRRWVQQRAYVMATTRRKKLARRQRLALKAAKLSAGTIGDARAQHGSRKAPALVSALNRVKLPRASSGAAAKMSREDDAAQSIQRCYRRHVRFVQLTRRRWRSEACSVEQRVLKRRRAAIAIQRRVRGQQARTRFRRLKALKRIRSFLLAWRWKRVVRFAQAARRIARWLRHKREQRMAQLWRRERARQHTLATRIQRLVRRRLVFGSKLAVLLAAARRREETRRFCEQSLVVCTQHVTDDIVLASLHRGFEDAMRSHLQPSSHARTGRDKASASSSSPSKRVPQASSVSSLPRSFPVLQLVFLVVAGAKDPTKWSLAHDKTLLQTTLERSRVVALFKTVNKHFADSVKRTSSTLSVASSTVLTALPQLQGSSKAKAKASSAPFFSMTDVDLALAKAGGTSKRALVFDEFTRVLRLLSEMKLAHVTLWWSKYDGSDAQLLALLWGFVFVLPELAPVVALLDDVVQRELHARCTRIQELMLRGRNRKRGLVLLLQQRQQLDAAAKARAATLVQARVRSLLAKRALRQRMQSVYEKYIDPDWGLPYWTNPVSGYSTWVKPRVLRAEDVATEVVPYPPAHLTLKISCDGDAECIKCAEWLCVDCDEFFCRACLPVFHKDKTASPAAGTDGGAAVGTDGESLAPTPQASSSTDSVTTDNDVNAIAKVSRPHEMEAIALCGLCQFQVASRKCLDCFTAAATSKSSAAKSSSTVFTSGNASPKRSREAESLFCDVCFAYAHRRGALTVHKSLALLELCSACTTSPDDGDDEDSDGATVNTIGSSTATTLEALSKPPVLARAVQWRCATCDRYPRVCGQCVTTRHPRELCGADATRVTLQTRSMLERAQRLTAEREARDRADVDKMKQRALAAKRERCATKLQRVWRRRVPVLRAKHVASERKRLKHAHWLQVQADAKREKQLVYLVRNVFGLAKPLATDTAVRRKLRAMNALQRRQLTIRARMFGLLVHEYMRVGIPLPGTGRIVHGANGVLETTEDLRGWVKNRQTLRLKRVVIDANAPRAQQLEHRSAWFHLANWDDDEGETGTGADAKELLVDIHAKEKVTEHRISLAQAVPAAGHARREDLGDGGNGTAAETTGDGSSSGDNDLEERDQVFVMYLVEYSMDPRRVVWINHSLYVRAPHRCCCCSRDAELRSLALTTCGCLVMC